MSRITNKGEIKVDILRNNYKPKRIYDLLQS